MDARLERDIDVRFETVTVDDMLVSMSGASLRLLILDACRNNPLARSMQRTAATRTVSGGSFADLNEDLLGDETLVAYAAAAGTTAADGRGRNSPYKERFLRHRGIAEVVRQDLLREQLIGVSVRTVERSSRSRWRGCRSGSRGAP